MGETCGRGERVLVTLPLEGDEPKRFEALMPQAAFRFCAPREASREDVLAATVIMGDVPREYVPEAGSLRWMHLPSAGADHFKRPGALPEGVVLTSSVGAYGQSVSEHSLASLLAVMKKLELYRDNQSAHLWRDEGPVTTLAGARVAVVGTGDLGTHFATLCHALGATCVGVHRQVTGGLAPCFAEEHALDELPSVLPSADVVACFLPSAPETRGMAGAAFFSAMRPGAYFVNAGRGDLVDQEALCDALESGHLAGAALDVASPEPLPADSRLWGQRNLLLTPHVAGFYHLPVTRDNVVRIAQENLRRYAAGEDLLNVQ